MKEREINEKRHWKAEVFPYDVFIPDGSNECSYCLTYNQATLLRGLLEPVGWKTRWWSDTTDVSKDEIEAFRDDIIRRLMMGCCDDNFIFIYDENGDLQKSEDGGVTYTPAPQDDIRIYPKVNYPPIPNPEEDDITCFAADSAVVLIKEQIGDQLTDDMSRYTLGQLIHDWTTTVIGTSNPFEALLLVVTNQIMSLLIASVRAALTDSVYDKLRCIFQQHMNSVAFFDGAAWEAVRTAITDEIGGVAGIFLEHLIYLIGNGGLSNLARSQAGSHDATCCPDCDPLLWTIWNGEENYGTVVEYGVNYVTIDLMSAPSTVGEYYGRMKTDDINTCCTIAGWEVLSGGILHISAGGACGEAQTGGGGLSISETEPSGPFNRFAFGATGPCRVKITFQ